MSDECGIGGFRRGWLGGEIGTGLLRPLSRARNDREETYEGALSDE
jgi:hypothetical protein